MIEANDARTGIKPEPLVISRIFGAPPALVFKAWSTADHMRRWFCPADYTIPHATVDFQPGGVCEICMRAPDGQEHWSKGRYLEIVPPERLAFSPRAPERASWSPSRAPSSTATTMPAPASAARVFCWTSWGNRRGGEA